MRVMLLDDERLALTQLERFLSVYEGLELVGSFINAKQALNELNSLEPDVIFLDIHMPEINGIEAALRIQELRPDTDIIFVTAYNQYAIQAFELNALDYLLKPISRTRLDNTMERLLGNKRKKNTEDDVQDERQNKAVGITCFHSLRFQYVNNTAEVPPWRTSKAQELFAYLLHHNGDIVRKSTLLELIWPDLDKKRAMTQMYTTVYLVRQCLSKMNMDIEIKNLGIQEGYVLDATKITIETEQWERELSELDGPVEEIHETLNSLLVRYEGDYLADNDYVWAESERERLYKLWLRHAYLLAEYYANAGNQLLEAIELYEKLAARDCYNEEISFTLLQLYDRAGKILEVKAYYKQLSDTFAEELNVELPRNMVKWYQEWEKRVEKA